VADPVMLIDTSMPGGHAKILAEVESLGINPQSIAHILLTHHDVDHMGNAAALKNATGATIWSSMTDRPFIQGDHHRPGVKRLVELIIKTTPTLVDATFNEENPELGKLSVVPSPGHTPGLVAFLYYDILFGGPVGRPRMGRLRASPSILTWNRAALQQSLVEVGKLEFDWICPAHGQPIRRGDLWDTLLPSAGPA
jgi:glyoxylase-like metal-dependent hydrolase (beta-lactamase superfamily II)